MRVTIERHKWPDVPHYEYDATYLGDDEHGSWYFAPSGNEIRRAGEVLFHSNHLSLYLVPVDRPWMVWFGANPSFDFDVYVDVGTVPVRLADRITMVDLDLDVVRRASGAVDVLDEDELITNAEQYGYPPALIADAERIAAEVVSLIEAGVEPFAHASEEWTRRALAALVADRGSKPWWGWPRRIALVVLTLLWVVVVWAYWQSRADSADARECGEWARQALDAYERADSADERANLLAGAERQRPEACDRLDDARQVTTDSAGGPVGGDPMSVEEAGATDLDACDGGFAVRGHAFLDGSTLTLCEAVAGSPPTCQGDSLESASEGDVIGIEDGEIVTAAMTSRSGRIVTTSIVAAEER